VSEHAPAADASAPDAHPNAHASTHHGPTVKAYWIVFVLLAVLTLVEIQIPTMIDAGDRARPSGMLVIGLMVTALIKAGLVAAFYMHLKYDSRTYTYMMIVATIVIMFFLWLLTWGTVGPLDFDLFSSGMTSIASRSA